MARHLRWMGTEVGRFSKQAEGRVGDTKAQDDDENGEELEKRQCVSFTIGGTDGKDKVHPSVGKRANGLLHVHGGILRRGWGLS